MHNLAIQSDNRELYLNEGGADVYFVIEGQRVPAHRCVLAARSSPFAALLSGSFMEASQQEVILESWSLAAFKLLLKVIYVGCDVATDEPELTTLVEAFELAHLYDIEELCVQLADALSKHITLELAGMLLNMALLYKLDELEQRCLSYCDEHAEELLRRDDFANLSRDALSALLERESFTAPEALICEATVRWAAEQPASDWPTDWARLLRLELLNASQRARFGAHFRIEAPPSCAPARYRYLSKPQIIFHGRLIYGNTTTRKPTEYYHRISAYEAHGLTYDLNRCYWLNFIWFSLRAYKSPNIFYTYRVFVSHNADDWRLLIDRREYACSERQELYFEAQPVRYVRLLGSSATKRRKFTIMHFGAAYVKDAPELQQHLHSIFLPKYNLLRAHCDAKVLFDWSPEAPPFSVLKARYKFYRDSLQFLPFQSKKSVAVLRFPQPYVISRIRVNPYGMWHDPRLGPSIAVETSTDGIDWRMILRTTQKLRDKFFTINFEPHVAVFVRLMRDSSYAVE